jgi:hypothetical protein
MSQREHAKALRRSIWTRPYPRKTLGARCIGLITPWPVWGYPGSYRALAELTGVRVTTARKYINGWARMPLARRERLAAYLEADLAERLEVIRLLKLPDERDEKAARGRQQALAKAQAASRAKRVARVRDRTD